MIGATMDDQSEAAGLSLGAFLRDRRSKLDPETLGFPKGRRRTSGLRRGEVAMLADISTDWYTWLEQGRGGKPSADVLERLAKGLSLNGVEREHLFLLAQRQSASNEESPDIVVSPVLRRILDNIGYCPAYIRTATWDVVACNRSIEILWQPIVAQATAGSRINVLSLFFDIPHDLSNERWFITARKLVATFRASVVKSGSSLRSRQIVQELSSRNAVFRSLWEESEVAERKATTKKIDLLGFGIFRFDYCEFRIEGQHELTMVVFSPSSGKDDARIREIVDRNLDMHAWS